MNFLNQRKALSQEDEFLTEPHLKAVGEGYVSISIIRKIICSLNNHNYYRVSCHDVGGA